MPLVAPYTWTLAGGKLPGGLTLSSDGEISGTLPGPMPPPDHFTGERDRRAEVLSRRGDHHEN